MSLQLFLIKYQYSGMLTILLSKVKALTLTVQWTYHWLPIFFHLIAYVHRNYFQSSWKHCIALHIIWTFNCFFSRKNCSTYVHFFIYIYKIVGKNSNIHSTTVVPHKDINGESHVQACPPLHRFHCGCAINNFEKSFVFELYWENIF